MGGLCQNRSVHLSNKTLVAFCYTDILPTLTNCRGGRKAAGVFSKTFLRGCVGRCGDFGIELRKIKIREHASKLAERLSEAKPSCSLPISVFSMFPDFVIFLNSMERSRNCQHISAEYVLDKTSRTDNPKFYSASPSALMTSTTLSTCFSQISSVAASTMTRIKGSVPLSRTRIRPSFPSSSATFCTAA